MPLWVHCEKGFLYISNSRASYQVYLFVFADFVAFMGISTFTANGSTITIIAGAVGLVIIIDNNISVRWMSNKG